MEPERMIVKGRRSPEWSFMSRLKLIAPDGTLYLDRLRLIQTPWFGIFLHAIVGPDPDPHPHDHPWNFWSLVLRGGYIEEFHMGLAPHMALRRLASVLQYPFHNRWGLLSFHKMPAEGVAHRITQVKPHTWTLVFVGQRYREWGFWTEGGWEHFRDYEAHGWSKQPASVPPCGFKKHPSGCRCSVNLEAPRPTTSEERRQAMRSGDTSNPENVDHGSCRASWDGGLATYDTPDGPRCRTCDGPVIIIKGAEA